MYPNKPVRRYLKSYPLQLLAFLALPLLILLVLVSFGGLALHQAAMRQLLANHDAQVVVGIARGLSERLEVQRQMLAGLAEQFPEAGSPQSALDSAQGWSMPIFDGGLAVYEGSGQLVAATQLFDQMRRSPGIAGLLPDAIQSATNSESRFSVLVDAGDQRTLIATIVEIPESASGDQILVGLTAFETSGGPMLTDALHASSGAVVYVIDNQSQILYHSNPATIGQMAFEPSPAGPAQAEGGEVIVTSAPVPETGWTVVREERWYETIGPLMRYSQAAPLVLLPGLLIAAGAVWLGIRRIVRPLQRLESLAVALAWGDFGSIEQPVGGIEEIQQLQKTMAHLAARVQATQAGMHNYIAAITQAQEDERARLARELHDQTVQSLIALDYHQQRLKRYLVDEQASQTLLSELHEMAGRVIDDLRRVIRAMRPIYLEDLGLGPALEMLARDRRLDWPAVQIHFDQRGEPSRLSLEREMALYRMAQEALNNALRHSQASHIWLAIAYDSSQVVITVRDDGRGFEAPQRVTDLSEKRHFGLMGMHERAALVGGHLQIQSTPANGTQVTIRIPLPPIPPSETHP